MTFPRPDSERDKAIVLVHGAWVGDWSWLPIVGLLQASGRPLHNIALTGHGSRRHQSGPHITLSDHVMDVVETILVHDLTNVTLVGHSYGGRVITRVAGEIGERLGALVYVDAHAPVADDTGASPERDAIAAAHGGMLPFAAYDPDPSEVGGDEGVRWFLERTVPTSYACLTGDWVGPLPDHVIKTFVYATGNVPSRFARYAEVCRDDSDWNYVELDGSHWLMMTHPQEMAEIILEADRREQ